VVRPDPIPNSAVKHSLADGSGFIDSARVGCRQFFLKAQTQVWAFSLSRRERKENYFRTGSYAGASNSVNLSQTRPITILPNSTFIDAAASALSAAVLSRGVNNVVQRGNRGVVTKRGNVLTFKYANDQTQTWNPAYEVYSNGLKGVIYEKR
jgi:hypothetical protein